MIQAVMCSELLLSFSTVKEYCRFCNDSNNKHVNVQFLKPQFNELYISGQPTTMTREKETLLKLCFLTFPERVVYTSKSSCL